MAGERCNMSLIEEFEVTARCGSGNYPITITVMRMEVVGESGLEIKSWVSTIEKGVLNFVGSNETSERACQGGRAVSQGVGSADAPGQEAGRGKLLKTSIIRQHHQ